MKRLLRRDCRIHHLGHVGAEEPGVLVDDAADFGEEVGGVGVLGLFGDVDGVADAAAKGNEAVGQFLGVAPDVAVSRFPFPRVRPEEMEGRRLLCGKVTSTCSLATQGGLPILGLC